MTSSDGAAGLAFGYHYRDRPQGVQTPGSTEGKLSHMSVRSRQHLSLPEEFVLLSHLAAGKVHGSARAVIGCAAAELGELALRRGLLVRSRKSKMLGFDVYRLDGVEIELLDTGPTGLVWADVLLAELQQHCSASEHGRVRLNWWFRRHHQAFSLHRDALAERGVLRPEPGGRTGLIRVPGRQRLCPDPVLRDALIAEVRAAGGEQSRIDEHLLFLCDLVEAVGLSKELGVPMSVRRRMDRGRGVGAVESVPEDLRDTSSALAALGHAAHRPRHQPRRTDLAARDPRRGTARVRHRLHRQRSTYARRSRELTAHGGTPMLASWYDDQGPAADVLHVGELPDPVPGPGEVRVRVTVSGVNPGDTKKRRGWLGSSAIDPDPAVACLDPETPGSSPHFASWETEQETGRSAVDLKWSAPGTAARITPAEPLSLRDSQKLALRVFVPPNTTGTKFDVSVTDSSDRRVTLGSVQVDGLPGSANTASYWAQELRVPLSAATRAGLDLGHVKSLELTPRSPSGRAWLMDAWGWAPGTSAVEAAALPRVDVGRTIVKEGDSGTRTYRIPVEISGHGSGQVRVYVFDPDSGRAENRLVTVRPGSDAIDVPVEVKGDTVYGDDVEHDIVVKAVHNAVVGKYRGGVVVENDDPEPVITLSPVVDRVTEGEPLTWRLSVDAPAAVDNWVPVRVLPVTEGAELSTKDVDPQWLKDSSGDVPDPERPLSDARLWVWVNIPPGSTSVDFVVPIVRDQVAEPTEAMRLALTDRNADPLPDKPVLTGTVLEKP